MKFARIFEAQVVRQPFAQKRSLCAMGIPVSCAARPRAMRSSAARACARLFSRSTVMNALSFGFSRSMRSRYERVSSTLETLRAASEAASCLMDSPATSLDHFGNQIDPVLHGRGERLENLALVRFGDAIDA